MPIFEKRLSMIAADESGTYCADMATTTNSNAFGKQPVSAYSLSGTALPVTPPMMPVAASVCAFEQLSSCATAATVISPLSALPPTASITTTAPARMSIDDALRHQLSAIEATGAEENAFFVADLAHLHAQHRLWRAQLPRVHPFYAVKCNPSPPILHTLAALDVNFDCASKSEIQSVLEAGVSANRIIYANPCKQLSHIRYAVASGVRLMTFDNVDELQKVARISRDVGMVLRVLTDDTKSVCQLGLKFGAPMERVESLLVAARDLGIRLAGVSFHVGSGCYDAAAFADAVQRAKRVIELGSQYGHREMHLVDVGGGFPGSDMAAVKFETIAEVLRVALDEHFPPESGVQLIAEPGRYFVDNAFTLAVNVIARRVVAASSEVGDDAVSTKEMAEEASANGSPSFMYYVNDGVYGSFNCTMFDHAVVTPRLLLRNGQFHCHDHPHQRPEHLTNCEAPAMYTAGGAATDDSGFECDSDSDSIQIPTPGGSITIEDAVMKVAPILPALYECSIWGPTCDSIDRINARCLLPELRVGDWLRYDRMGAYTLCAASRFNGFRQSHIVYIDTTDACTTNRQS